jgi:hypothetical protein
MLKQLNKNCRLLVCRSVCLKLLPGWYLLLERAVREWFEPVMGGPGNVCTVPTMHRGHSSILLLLGEGAGNRFVAALV